MTCLAAAMVAFTAGAGSVTVEAQGPAESIVEFLEAHGVSLTSDQMAAALQAADLSGDVADPLVMVLDAFADYEATATAILAQGGDFDDPAILAEYVSLLEAGSALQDSLGAPSATAHFEGTANLELFLSVAGEGDAELFLESEAFLLVADGDADAGFSANACAGFPLHLDVPPVLNINLKNEDNVYTENYLLSVDTCGDDVYLNNAGGNNLIQGSCLTAPAAGLFDLSGDDQYGPAPGLADCGINGGGTAGAGFLLDGSGDDNYVAGSRGTNGGGALGGSGLLVDLHGDDSYAAVAIGVNGGGVLGGAGKLIDVAGRDNYTAENGGTNGGAVTAAKGFIFDGAGNDNYTAGGSGANGGGALGNGLLFDRAGIDVYLDLQGGSGTDVTVIPKGVVGAQVDYPVLP